MSSIVEMLSGIMRYFPNTMLITLFVVGITTGKIAWVLIAIGGVLVAMLTLTFQYLTTKAFGIGPVPGMAVIDSCSLIPIITTQEYSTTPSIWTALTAFFIGFIFMNANHIYSAKTSRGKKEIIPVQERKGIGLISMLSVSLLFLFLVVARYWKSCETIAGLITGLVIGIGGAVGWWYILSACGADVYPDIHGVMIGLRPANLRTNPVACITL